MVVKKYVALFFLLMAFSLYGEDELSMEYKEDWLRGEVIFDISVKLPTGEMKPTNRFVAEQFIESEAPGLIADALVNFRVDSRNSLGSLYYSDVLFYNKLEELIGGQNKIFSKTTPDMKEFIIRYSLKFCPDLVSLFLSHDRPVAPDYLAAVRSDDEQFTGLAVYAADPVPFHGSDEMVKLNPALFPTVYDEDMNLIFDKTFVEPESLLEWGMVQYSQDIPDTFLETRERIGMKPMKISLREVYGNNGCDLIVSREDGQMILSSTEFSDWLRKGKVIIIIGR